MIVSIKEAREILGDTAEKMSDDEIAELIMNLDGIAVAALRDAIQKRKDDAFDLARLIYDIYKDKKSYDSKNLQ